MKTKKIKDSLKAKELVGVKKLPNGYFQAYIKETYDLGYEKMVKKTFNAKDKEELEMMLAESGIDNTGVEVRDEEKKEMKDKNVIAKEDVEKYQKPFEKKMEDSEEKLFKVRVKGHPEELKKVREYLLSEGYSIDYDGYIIFVKGVSEEEGHALATDLVKKFHVVCAVSTFTWDSKEVKDSQAQEIAQAYRNLSEKYNLDFEDLVYGPEGFMAQCYPNDFPDFRGDVIFSEKYWNEFEQWLKDTKGITLDKKDDYDFFKDSNEPTENYTHVVYMWPNAGYELIPFYVNSDTEDTATLIAEALAQAVEKGEKMFYFTEEELEDLTDEEKDTNYVYFDLSELGLPNVYISEEQLYNTKVYTKEEDPYKKNEEKAETEAPVEDCNTVKDEPAKMTYGEISDIFYNHNKENGIKQQFSDPNPLEAVIVFSSENWPDKDYSLESRSYKFSSDNKGFLTNMIGSSVYGESLDKSDRIRIDWYLHDWKVDYCYLISDLNQAETEKEVEMEDSTNPKNAILVKVDGKWKTFGGSNAESLEKDSRYEELVKKYGKDNIKFTANKDLDKIKDSGEEVEITIPLAINLKEWYTKEFPTDPEGEYLNKDITLQNVYDFINKYGCEGPNGDFYDFIGAGDSLVRERIFEKIAKELNVSYEDIYNKWLRSDVDDSIKTKCKDSFKVEFFIEGNLLEGKTEEGFETFEEAEEFAEDEVAIISQNGIEKEIPLEDITYEITYVYDGHGDNTYEGEEDFS